MRRVMSGLMVAVAFALVAASCGDDSDDTATEDPASTEGSAGEESNGAFPATIADAAGNEHTFDGAPQIGCWWAGCREVLADLGVLSHAEGWVDEGPDEFAYPNGFPEHSIEDTTNPEDWAAAEVDVIILRVPDDPEDAAMEQAAPIFYLHHPSYGDSSQTGIDAYYENLRLMGQMTGEVAAAEDAIDRFDATVAALQDAAPDGAADTVVAPIFGNFTDSYRISGRENPFCSALADFELGTCVDGETGEMNGEAFLALDPDWIAVMASEDGGADRSDPVWDRLTAVQDGHVYEAHNRIYCCSLRGLTHALQEYGHFVWGDAGGIPDPGALEQFNPTTDAVR